MFLARAVDEYRAERAATGWGGDGALLFAPPDVLAAALPALPAGASPSLSSAAPPSLSSAAPPAGVPPSVSPTGAAPPFAAWITTWDDDTDAEDFAAQAALVLGVLARAPVAGDRHASTPGRLRAIDSAGRVYAIERRRRAVGMLFAAPAEAEAVLNDLMSAVAARPGRRPPPAQGRVRSR